MYMFIKNTEATYFLPEKISLIGENFKSFNETSTSYSLSHRVYLLISKNDEQRYSFWSFSQRNPSYFEKKQLYRNKEQSWIRFALNSYV